MESMPQSTSKLCNQVPSLTPNTPLIHTSVTLNMDDLSVLTGLLGYLKITIEIPPSANMVIFVSEFCNLGRKSSLYEVNQ